MPTKSELYKKNYWLLVLEGTFFMGATSFYNSSTVVPVFINSVTDSKQLIGFTLTFASVLMYVSRLAIGPYVPYIRNHVRFTTLLMFSLRPVLLVPAIFVFLRNDSASIIALILAYAALWFCDGMVAPVWSEVLVNTVDDNRHGRLLGMQMLLGGFAGIGAGVLINIFFLDPMLDTKMAFGWIFILGGVCSTLSCVMMSLTKNAPQPYKTGRVDIAGYFRDLPEYLKHENDFVRMMIVQFLFLSASMCGPFFILYSGEGLGISQSIIPKLILAQSVGLPLGGWLWGYICDKLGSHNGLRLAGVNILLPAALSLAATAFDYINPMLFMFPVLFLIGVNGGTWTCYYVYTIQAVRPKSRTACIVLSGMITLPTAFTGYLAGYIAEKYGYIALFITCIALLLPGLTLSLKLRSAKTVREDRDGYALP